MFIACLFKGSQEQSFFLQTLLFTAFLATVLKNLTYALVSTWSLVRSLWEHVKRKMYPCDKYGHDDWPYDCSVVFCRLMVWVSMKGWKGKFKEKVKLEVEYIQFRLKFLTLFYVNSTTFETPDLLFVKKNTRPQLLRKKYYAKKYVIFRRKCVNGLKWD